MKHFRLKRHSFLCVVMSLLCSNCQTANADALAVFTIKPVALKRYPVPALKPVFSVIATGDLMMTSRVKEFVDSEGVHYPFLQTGRLLQAADIAVSNLEAPFTLSGTPFKKKFIFRTPPHYITGICSAGIDLLTLANNHILDYGVEGLQSTLALLDKYALHHCGAGMNRNEAEAPAIVKVRNKSIAFLAFSLTYPEEFWSGDSKPGTAFPHKTRLANQIHSLKHTYDYVIISFHWGAERMTYPKYYQKMYAHLAIDSGADAVIGHHPHVLQGLEIYKNKLIAYSLGNYVFGSYSNTVDYSVLLKIWFDENGGLMAVLYPVDVNNYRVSFQPTLLGSEKKDAVIDYLNKLSKPLNDEKLIIHSNGSIRLQ